MRKQNNELAKFGEYAHSCREAKKQYSMTVLFIIILHSVPFRINTHYCNRLFIESENNKVGLGQLGHELSDGVDPLRDGREI